MFEQSVVEARALTARPWTLAVSVMGQAVLITAAVVLPMLHPDTLRKVVMLAAPIGGPPTAYKTPEPQRVEPGRQVVTSRSLHAIAFVAPSAVPATITMVQDVLPEMGSGVPGGGSPTGVPGSIGVPGGSGVGTSVLPPPPIPPTKDVVHPVTKTPPTAPPPTQIKRGGDVQASLLIYRPEPVYPPLAKQARISGVVRLSAIVGTDGKIAGLRVLSGHPLLVASAMDAVKRWVYSPTLLNSVPVEVLTEITVTFTLN